MQTSNKIGQSSVGPHHYPCPCGSKCTPPQNQVWNYQLTLSNSHRVPDCPLSLNPHCSPKTQVAELGHLLLASWPTVHHTSWPLGLGTSSWTRLAPAHHSAAPPKAKRPHSLSHFLTLQTLLQTLSSSFPPHHSPPRCYYHQGLQCLHCCSTLGMSSRPKGFDHTLLDSPSPVLKPTLSWFSSSDTFTQGSCSLDPHILPFLRVSALRAGTGSGLSLCCQCAAWHLQVSDLYIFNWIELYFLNILTIYESTTLYAWTMILLCS